MSAVSIIRVANRRDQARFFRYPYDLYKGHPYWVPNLRIAERALQNQDKNPFFAHGAAQHFLATRGDRVVGRIAAVENRLHNEMHEDRLGFFGFFDAEEGEVEGTRALVEAAHAWCRERGLEGMRGPTSYSMNDVIGVLVDGFEQSNAVMMPYNRPDYDALLLEAGLVGVKDLLAFYIDGTNPVPERFRRVVNRRLERKGITIRGLHMDRFKAELETIHDLYGRCWEKNWGFVPATDAEFEHAASDLKMLVHTGLSAIAERDGEAVGFSVFIRDINEVIPPGSNGRLFPTLWWRLLRKVKQVKATRCILLGVVPEARGNAINEAFFMHALESAKATTPPTSAEPGWVLADNERMVSPILASGGEEVKRYRMYEVAP